MMTTKQKKRWRSKKRKVEAFLEVTRLNTGDVAAQKLAKRQRGDADDDTIRKAPTRDVDPEKCHGDDAETSSSDDEHTDKGATPKTLTAEELAQVRENIRARQKAGMKKPKFFLTLEKIAPASSSDATRGQQDPEVDRSPLFVLDLQHLLLYAVQGNLSSYKPRWCKLLRWTKVSPAVVIILEGVGADDYRKHPDWFPFLHQQFDAKAVEMISSSQYGVPVAEELFRVPLSWAQTKKACRETSTRNVLYEKLDRLREVISVLLPIGVGRAPVGNTLLPSPGNKVSRKDLLLNTQQLIQEAYPMPVKADQFRDFIYSREDYGSVTDSSPLFAIDCEMCQTAVNMSELTRVSVVNEQLETVYDSLVKPRNRITNYLTRFSGITKNKLKDVTTDIEEVQSVIQGLLPPDAILCGQSLNGDLRALKSVIRGLLPPDAILCGQSLNGDLRALKMFHPYVIDTSVVYNLSGNRVMKPGLKKLSEVFLGKTIQDGHEGHDSIEDATSCMELVKLKLQHGKEFGDVILGGVIYPTMKKPEHRYQEENSSSHAPLPESRVAAVSTDAERQTAAANTNDKHSAGGDKIVPKSGCLSHVTPGGADSVDRKRVFFQRPGSSQYDSFFTLAQEAKKSVALVDRSDSLTSYVDEGGVTTHSVTSDKEAVRKAKACLWETFLVCTHLRGYTDAESTADFNMEMTLRKLDKRVRKLLAHVGENALVTVLLAGRETNTTSQNALCFTKIT